MPLFNRPDSGVYNRSMLQRRFAVAAGIISSLLYLFAGAYFAAAVISVIYGDGAVSYFSVFCAGALVFAFAFGLFWRKDEHVTKILKARHGFFIVALSYLFLGLWGAIPFWIIPGIATSFTDAAFESFSGLTTTGATTFVGLDEMPESVLFYRQVLQWLGGMGIIVLALAILPMLGVGGTQLFKAESPGATWDNPLHMRVKDTAKQYWILYTGLTLVCAGAYWLAGMSMFDAICHSFSTIAIGGFSTHDQSIGYFNSVAIESVAVVFMVVAGFNFATHYFALQAAKLRRTDDTDHRLIFRIKRAAIGIWKELPVRVGYYWRDEPRFFLLILCVVSLCVVLFLLLGTNGQIVSPIRVGLFQSISFATTTGYTTTDYQSWPIFCPVLLVFAAFAGGCNGSTAGGLKIYRVLLMIRQGTREIHRLIYPNAMLHVRLDDRSVTDDIVESVWGFVAVYATCFVVLVCILLAITDLRFITVWSAAAACLNNLGPGLGEVVLNYTAVPSSAKWVLMLAMVLGRLEIFTILVLFAPRYWRR